MSINTSESFNPTPKPTVTTGAKFKAGVLVALSSLYLLNLSFGILEIPDNLPFIGNLDELAASAILISALKAFGIDWSNILPFLRIKNRHGK